MPATPIWNEVTIVKLQLALDVLSLSDALALARAVEGSVERFEMGTPFLLEYGMEAIRRFRAAFPEKELLADLKIMDAGALEAEAAFRAGADLVTVLAVTDTATVRACVASARNLRKKVVADMICVPNLAGRAMELEALGVHGIAVHTGVDQQAAGRTPLQDLRELRPVVKGAELSVAGGISLATAADYCRAGADVLIVGGAIAGASDPAREALAIHHAITSLSIK